MMILGGSRIGIRIATELQEEVNIKLVDYNAEKAYRLAELLDKTLIINEDGRNTEAMMEEGLSNMDAFVAVTGRSETNILAAMLAKRMGVKKVIAEVENLNYINLAESIGIDTIINKKLVTASNIFRFTMSHRRAGHQVPDGQRCRGAGVHRQAQRAGRQDAGSRIWGCPKIRSSAASCAATRSFIAVDNMEINPYDRVVVFAMPASGGQSGDTFLTDGACRRGPAHGAGQRTPPAVETEQTRVIQKHITQSMVFAARAGHRPFPAPAGRDAGTRLQDELLRRGRADRIRLALRSGACPHASSSSRRWSRRSITRRSSPTSRRCWPGEKNVAAPGRVKLFARSSGTTSDRSKYMPGHGGVALVEPYAGHARRGDGLFGQQSEDTGFSKARR